MYNIGVNASLVVVTWKHTNFDGTKILLHCPDLYILNYFKLYSCRPHTVTDTVAGQQQHCCMVVNPFCDQLSDEVLQVVNLRMSEHDLPAGVGAQQAVPKFYRMIIKNTLYYSVKYKRVKIRNSYTVVYIDSDDGKEHFGKIVFFLQLYMGNFAVLLSPDPLPVTCQAHFGLAHTALDLVHRLIPVNDCGCLKCVPAFAIVCKCVYIAIDGIQTYVVTFPNQLLSD